MAEKEEIDREWEIIIKQYELNREEQLDKKDRIFKITVLGIGGIATLAGIAYEHQIYALFLIMPLLILTSVLIYNAECNAVINMSNYGYDLEKKFILVAKELGWERWLRNDGDSDKRLTYYISELGSVFVLIFLYIWSIAMLAYLPEIGIKFFNWEILPYILIILYIIIGFPLFIVSIRNAGKRYDQKLSDAVKFIKQLLKSK